MGDEPSSGIRRPWPSGCPSMRPSASARLWVARCVVLNADFSGFFFDTFMIQRIEFASPAEVAELVDAHGSGPCGGNTVGVRVPSSAPLPKHCFLRREITPA